jgi:hypothetical protein
MFIYLWQLTAIVGTYSPSSIESWQTVYTPSDEPRPLGGLIMPTDAAVAPQPNWSPYNGSSCHFMAEDV